MEIVLIICLQIILIFMTLMVIFEKNLLKAIIYMAIYSSVISVIYYFLKAPDVALAEISIGGGISTLILIKGVEKSDKFIIKCSDRKSIEHMKKIEEFCDYMGYKVHYDFNDTYSYYDLEIKNYNDKLIIMIDKKNVLYDKLQVYFKNYKKVKVITRE